jgi:uncharacterized protein
MPKAQHELRDPIHNFVRVEDPERAVLDSRPFQRLRHIHQLAMAYLVYPGATHKRFEHSLGVMELAGRVFDVVTNPNNLTDRVRHVVPKNVDLGYWRRVVRMAALCHDIGHLPFSHAAEKELLPKGWTHERLTDELVRGAEMRPIWETLKVFPEDVAKLAIGAKTFSKLDYRQVQFSLWETILAEIIVGDAFGVDRMDYLLRDSYHAGVAYGKFDHYRLIDTLRIVPKPGTDEPALGIEIGGLHAAEALLLARYFMYSQVYFHHTRRACDIHLTEFLNAWLANGYKTDLESHLALTDNEVLVALRAATGDPSAAGHEHARRLVTRAHFRLLYRQNPEDVARNPNAADAIATAAKAQYGPSRISAFPYTEKSNPLDFPVLYPDGRTVASRNCSAMLNQIPAVSVGYVFIDPDLKDDGTKWLAENRSALLAAQTEGEK